MNDKLIDVEKLIAQKKPKLLKWLPRFVIRYLKRILHQERINQIVLKNKDVVDQDFCIAVLKELNINYSAHGLDNVPKDGSCIFVANHPLGGIDALVIVAAISKKRQDIRFIVNDILLHLKSLKNLFVGINKFGQSAKSALQGVNDLFASDKAIFIFPAGLVSRKIKGVIKDLTWKKTFISQAIKHNKPVVPVYIDGVLSPFFYRLSRIRKILGIKINIEMLYLADELFKQSNKHIHVHFGAPISPENFPQGSHAAIAQFFQDQVYALASKETDNTKKQS
jgi:putative hemolysin